MIEHGFNKPFMITFLWRKRAQCETKEDYEAAHKDKDSIGDNLENFISDLKSNKYCFENAGLDSMDSYDCYHYAMLTSKEEQEIQNPDSDFLWTFLNFSDPDVSKTKMAKSDSKHKYVASYCTRTTYII